MDNYENNAESLLASIEKKVGIEAMQLLTEKHLENIMDLRCFAR